MAAGNGLGDGTERHVFLDLGGQNAARTEDACCSHVSLLKGLSVGHKGEDQRAHENPTLSLYRAFPEKVKQDV